MNEPRFSCEILPNAMQRWRRDRLAVQAQGEDLGNCSPVANSGTDRGMSVLGVNNFIGECRELCTQTLMTPQCPSPRKKKWREALYDVSSSQFSNPCLPPENPRLSSEIAFAFLRALWTVCATQREAYNLMGWSPTGRGNKSLQVANTSTGSCPLLQCRWHTGTGRPLQIPLFSVQKQPWMTLTVFEDGGSVLS